jgi:1-acyl-sn-glycerol-3-phosphate acyltransferase
MVVILILTMAMDLWLRPAQNAAAGAETIHRYCRRIVRALGIWWTFEGDLPQRGAIVSNHLSYLDILLYSSIQPFVMVAKSEVRHWPGIGWLTKQAGTVYVVRGGDPSTYPEVNRAMAEAYRSGIPVLFFPEGTTTNGAEVLPFKRGLFHSVLNEAVPLHTAALNYVIENGDGSVADDVCWWGDATLLPHITRLAAMKSVRAKVRFGAAIQERQDRFVLSETAHGIISEMYTELSYGITTPVSCAHQTELLEAL